MRNCHRIYNVILVETKIYWLRLRYIVWDRDTLSKTKIYYLRLTNYYCLCNSIVYIASPLAPYFSPAINSFPLLNSLAIYFITLALLPLLPKSLSLSTAHISSALIHYNHFNSHLLRLSIATLMSHFSLFFNYSFFTFHSHCIAFITRLYTFITYISQFYIYLLHIFGLFFLIDLNYS